MVPGQYPRSATDGTSPAVAPQAISLSARRSGAPPPAHRPNTSDESGTIEAASDLSRTGSRVSARQPPVSLHHFVQYCRQLAIERRSRDRPCPQPHHNVQSDKRRTAAAENLAHPASHPVTVHRMRQQFLRDDRAEARGFPSIGSNADNEVSAAERPSP